MELNNYDLSVIRHRKEELKHRLRLSLIASQDDWIVPTAYELVHDLELLLDHIDNHSVK